MKNLLLLIILNALLNLFVQLKITNKNFTYLNIIITSLVIIFVGIEYFSTNKNILSEEYIDKNLAYLYPFILSILLLSIYLIITYFSKYKQIVLSLLFFTSITTSMCRLYDINKYLITTLVFTWFLFSFLTNSDYKNFKIYVNNIIAIQVAVSAIKIIDVEDINTAVILLSGLFIFDIFWVFGSKAITNESVMEKVAVNVDYPVLLKFFNHGKKRNTMLLGLGDIIIPALFIKTLIKYPFYYNLSYGTYAFGLFSSIVSALYFKRGQPALLYIVPALLSVIGVGKYYGDNLLELK